jgi:hypothetical protein
MNVRFWRRSPRLSEFSTVSNAADNSAVAGVSPSDPWVERMDRRAANFSLLAKISAWSVVGGILLEDWDVFGMAWKYHFPYLIREGAGGLIVAIAIAWEVRFSSLEASVERQIRDRYAMRIAELNLKAEQEQHARMKLEKEIAWRDINHEQQASIRAALSPFAGLHTYVSLGSEGDEPKNFAGLLIAALGAANWDCVRTKAKAASPISTAGVYALATLHGNSQQAAKNLNAMLCSFGLSDGVDERSKWAGPPYWPEEIWNTGSSDTPKVLIVVKEKLRPRSL